MQLFPPALDKEWCRHFQTFRQDYGIMDSKRRAIDACLFARAIKLHDIIASLEAVGKSAFADPAMYKDVQLGSDDRLYQAAHKMITMLQGEILLLQIARTGLGT